jgi:hypothetical protein
MPPTKKHVLQRCENLLKGPKRLLEKLSPKKRKKRRVDEEENVS